MGLRTNVNIPKGKGTRRKALSNLRKTTKDVTRRINDTTPLNRKRGRSSGSIRDVGDDLANFSGIESAKRSRRPKDDPFNQIGL
jgi:hypothetical protein